MNTKCPYCNYLATEHETLDNQKNPKDGEISFCINCGEVSEYSGTSLIKVDVNSLDESTKEEIKKIDIAWLKSKGISNLKEKNNE